MNNPITLRYIDLFAGVGGFHHGIDTAYDQLTKRIQQGIGDEHNAIDGHPLLGAKPLCVYSNEWDKYANSVYRRHYGECDRRDIRTVKAEELPDFDLLAGGFPCQAFSVAGKRLGFDDTRGTLFYEIARIVAHKRPSYLLLENVKGLLSHDGGRTFATILGVLTDLGYDTQWQVLNSKNFGVPQSRERVYIVGHLREAPRPQVFPIAGAHEEDPEPSNDEQPGSEKFIKTRHLSQNGTLISDQITLQATEVPHLIHNVYGGFGEGMREFHDISPTIRTAKGGGHLPMVVSKTIRTGGRRSPHGSKQNWDSYEVDGTIRRLTPIECERLQGFPDNWTQLDALRAPVSDTQRYKMMGNAVTTKVVAAIMTRLLTTR